MRKFIIKLTKTEKKINHRYDFESPLNLDTARVNFECHLGRYISGPSLGKSAVKHTHFLRLAPHPFLKS